MKNFGITAAATVIILTLLLAAACAPRTAQPTAQPQPVQVEQPSPPADDVPEIAQAEQTVQEIGTEDIDEIDKDLDALVLP